ncbi:MAG TPA: tetratricopeptide repeat protein, partial [Kofleriaceae bacterium]|nr:tetratricopeptide repeat protein [Kofleriaceae bacterium]
TPEQLEKAKVAYAAGKAAFDAKQMDVAVEKFKESYRLSRNPLLLYNIGFTFDQMGQKDKALFYYQKFLADAPADAPQRAEVTPRAKTLETELAAAAAAEEGGDTTTTTPGHKPPPRPARTFDISEFDHQVIEEAPPGKPLDLTAYVPEGSGWVVTMYYRGAGDAKFTSVPMRPRYNELVGRIPASKMEGTSIQYYLEVRTADDKVLTRVGKPGSPNIVYLEAKARPRYYPDLDDDSGSTFEPVVTPPEHHGEHHDDGLTNGGWFDTGSHKFRRGKWIATGASVALMGTSLTFYLMAAGNSSSLEGEAALANDDSECGAMPKPCKTFGSYGRSLQQVGQRNELVSRVTFGIGVAAVGVAAYYWYKEVKAARKAEQSGGAGAATPPAASEPTGMSSLIVVPSASDGFLGGAAAVRF